MTDRNAREQMTKVIRSYMNEEITAFQLDDVLEEVMNATDDETVLTVGQSMWFHYDDCDDHRIVASKEEWNYFNRLLLLIESDCEVEFTETRRIWNYRQVVAAVFFGSFIVIAIRVGFGEHLFDYAIPFGIVSMILAGLNSWHQKRTVSEKEMALTPFDSVRSLLSVRRSVPGFMKRKYPESLQDRTVRSPLVDKLMWIPHIISWCKFSPVALFFQMLPENESEIRIKIPES